VDLLHLVAGGRRREVWWPLLCCSYRASPWSQRVARQFPSDSVSSLSLSSAMRMALLRSSMSFSRVWSSSFGVSLMGLVWRQTHVLPEVDPSLAVARTPCVEDAHYRRQSCFRSRFRDLHHDD
jgi:hypothetical protein